MADFDLLEFLDGLKTIIPDLPNDLKQTLREALRHVRNKTDAKHVKEWLDDPVKWRIPKVSLDTFLSDPHYLGGSLITEEGEDRVFPKVRQMCREIIEGGYLEGVEVAGIGSGKSFSSQILACYAAQHLLCLNNPHENYNLAKDKNIAIMNMGTTATQAWEVVFSGIKSFVEASPFFMQLQPKVLGGSITFESHKVLLVSGNSKSTTPLGYNVFAAVLDEAAFYLDNDNKNVAREIYEALQRRITSRFGNDGLLMMISSPRYVEDFIMKKLEESKELDPKTGLRANPHIYSIQLPTWKVQGRDKMPKNKRFFFNCRTNIIIDTDEMSEAEIRKTYKVNDVEQEDFDETYDVWQIPGEYRTSFRQDPEKAKRDYGAVPSLTLEGFFPNPSILKEVYNYDRKNPVTRPGKFEFVTRPLAVPYFIHIDIGMNRNGVGDFTGFAMGHFGGWVTDELSGEERMKFHIDLVERIGAPGGVGEVELDKVRQRIYDLKAMGYNIQLVTLDGYQSKDFMQILKKKGFKSDYQSVDKTMDAYNALKAAVNENRIDLPYVSELDSELARLEVIKGTKVDHPPGGSKDIADALAGVCWLIQEYTPANMMQMRTLGQTNKVPVALQQHIEQKAKEKAIEAQQRMLDKQDELLNKLGV